MSLIATSFDLVIDSLNVWTVLSNFDDVEHITISS